MTTRTRLIVTLAFSLALGVGLAAPAEGHSTQIGTSPAADARLDAVPTAVSVDFDTPLLDIGAALVVRTNGRTVSLDPPTVERRSISIDLDPAAPAGEYTVAYRVVSEDGHTIESTFAFTVEGPTPAATPSVVATAEPTPSAVASIAGTAEPTASAVASPQSTPASEPPYLLIGLGIAAMLALVIGALALSR